MIDLLVAGGGPIGLVTALHAARLGMRVVVLEPRTAPIDKACGEGLMPGAVAALDGLGIRPDGMPLRGIRYLSAADATASSGVADFPGRPGLGVRRTVLHRSLQDAACAAGVEMRAGKVATLEQSGDHVVVDGTRARWVVGADGLHSTVRGAVGLDCPSRTNPPSRWGIRAHYGCAPWSDRVEVHWAPRAEAYVTPVARDCVGVAVLGDDRAPFAERLQDFPRLAARLPRTPLGKPRAAGPLRQDVSGRVAGRVLLVGDAAGYVDALTGEGLSIGFACAQAAVQRLYAGDAAGYERDHARITRRYRMITSALLWAGRQPALRRRIVPLAAAQPWLFRRAVGALAQQPGGPG